MSGISTEKRSKSKTSEQKVWNTKYGPRRVKQALPTLQEAVFADHRADDGTRLGEKIKIAAGIGG